MKKLNRILAALLVFTMVFTTGMTQKTYAAADDAEYVTYTVKSGDFLWKIAANELGDGYRYKEIYQLNRDIIKDINLIYPGQVLKLPITVSAEDQAEETVSVSDLKVGESYEGFTIEEISHFDLINADLVIYTHDQTGATVMYLANDDTNRTFEITFKTPATDDSGVPHVFEHSTLDGSEKYPSKALFFNLSYQTYNTYMNAATYNFMTTYPVASLSEEQLLKYADYYTDSCFNPMIYEDESIFKEEAWRYVLNTADDDLTIAGTVYSEMLGAYTLDTAAYCNFGKTLFPGSTYGNESGGTPESIPTMTWEDLKEYHDTYYHPSNSLTCIYGKISNINAFLKLLDGYFSEYEEEDIVIEDSEYEPITEAVEANYSYGLEAGSDTNNGTSVYYGFVCKDMAEDDDTRLDMLTTLLGEDSSSFMQLMNIYLPQADTGCYYDFTSPEPAVIFYASGINDSDVETFRLIVDTAIADVVENGFDPDAVDAIIAANELDTLLVGETDSLGVNLIPNIAYYWAKTGNVKGYMEAIDALDNFRTYYEDGSIAAAAKKYLCGNPYTALVSTSPVAGLKEEEDAALAAKLADIKASMSEDEIAAIVAETNAEDEEDDASEYVKQLQAVTVESLPEEARIYDYTDETGSDSVRRIDVEANVDGVGEAALLLDASGLDQDSILYFKLFTALMGNMDTDEHTVAQLSSLMTRYLYSGTIKVSLIETDAEAGYTPYLRAGFIALDEDVEAAYDLLYELIYSTSFEDTTALKGQVSSLKNSLKSSINSSPYSAELYAAMADSSELNAYYYYTNFLDYYQFLCDVESALDTDPDSVVASLEAVQEYFNNSTNAVSAFVGSSESASNHREIADAFLDRLDSRAISTCKYSFASAPASFALIVDGSVNYNMLYLDFASAGFDSPEADMDAVTAYVSDAYLYPLLRDQYGAYGVLHGANDDGMYVISYRDPNIAETFDVYSMLPELVSTLSDLDQDTLDGYILSAYSYYAESSGELSGGLNAVFDIISGDPQEDIIEDMKSLKALTPEKAAEYAAMYSSLYEEGCLATAGSASAVSSFADIYETVYNPFGVEDATKKSFDDVNEDDWYYAAVRCAFENSLMSSESDTSFGAASDATLGDLALGFYKLVGGDDNVDDAIAFFVYYGILPDEPADTVLTRADILTCSSYLGAAFGADLTGIADDVAAATGYSEADFAENGTRADIAFALYYIYMF